MADVDLRVLFYLLTFRVGFLFWFVSQVAEYFFLQHLPALPRYASFGFRLTCSTFLQEIFNILDELIILYPTVLSPEPTIDGLPVIFLRHLLVLLLKDAIIPLKEILLHHHPLQLIPKDPHLSPIILILSDEVFDFFFIDSVELVGF